MQNRRKLGLTARPAAFHGRDCPHAKALDAGNWRPHAKGPRPLCLASTGGASRSSTARPAWRCCCAGPGQQINEHIAEPRDIVFRHACALGLEGIVSKRLGSRYRSGRSRDWIRSKNPAAPAVKREAEEDWGR